MEATLIPVQQAVKSALLYLQEIMPQYKSDEVRLEEVELDEADEHWVITFSAPGGSENRITLAGQFKEPVFGSGRIAKVVTISATDGRFVSVKHRG